MTALAPVPAETPIAPLAGARLALRRERALRKQIFRPPPKLTISEWADRHRYLSGLSSAEEGRWRTSRAPYQRGIMDVISDLRVQRVIWIAPSQCGKSELLLNTIGFFIDQDPSPMLMIQPTIEMARDFSEDRVKAGLIETSPRVRTKVTAQSGRRDPGNKMLRKTYPGGHLTLVGANSASGLASRPIRVLLGDEIDKYPPSAGDKGDPISLATNRTKTFWNRKIVLATTPGVLGASRSEKEWKESDQRRYFVPCPHCAHKQHLRWAQLKFDPTSGAVDGYCCEGCGVLIEERYKAWMLERGEWTATKPDGQFPGFHLNGLYSPWSPWADMVKKFLSAKDRPDTLQVFVNEDLAEWWDPQDGEGMRDDALLTRREPYAAEVPMGVGVLTAFVDVQKDWLELAVKGWGAGQESWLIAHHRLRGETSAVDVWNRLDPLLTKTYRHESGALMHIAIAGVDSGDGQNVHPVYTFVSPRQKRSPCTVFATKGSSVRGRPIVAGRASKRNKYGVRVIPVGTETAKDVIYQRLKIVRSPTGAAPPGFMHFPPPQSDGADDEYLRQFSREKVFIRYHHGVPVREYHTVPDGARNEAVDLEVGNLVMLHLLGAGVYDQLGMWAARARAEGDRAKAAPPAAAAPSETAAPDPDNTPDVPPAPAAPQLQQIARPQTPRRPGGGWVNGWRR